MWFCIDDITKMIQQNFCELLNVWISGTAPVRETIRFGMSKTKTGFKFHPSYEQIHPRKLVGGEPTFDVKVGWLPQCTSSSGTRVGRFVWFWQHYWHQCIATQTFSSTPRNRSAANVFGRNRTRRYGRSRRTQTESTQVYSSVEMPIFRRLVERQLVGSFGEYNFIASSYFYLKTTDTQKFGLGLKSHSVTYAPIRNCV